jgi:hypothetical protein
MELRGCCGRALKYGKKHVFGGREALLFESYLGSQTFPPLILLRLHTAKISKSLSFRF